MVYEQFHSHIHLSLGDKHRAQALLPAAVTYGNPNEDALGLHTLAILEGLLIIWCLQTDISILGMDKPNKVLQSSWGHPIS